MRRFVIGDDLILDSSQRKVFKAGAELNLSELSYRLLLTLVENAPNIVSHDDLMTAVWHDRIVSDENLKKRVSRLRETLSETSENPKYFIAERSLGYRCIAQVSEQVELNPNKGETKPIIGKPTPSNKKVSIFLISAIPLIALCVLFAITYSDAFTSASSEKKSSSNNDYAFQAIQYYSRFNLTDNNRAIDLYKKALEEENSGSTYSGMANAYAQGYYQFGKGELWLEQAYELSQKAIELEPESPWGYASLGFTLYLKGHYSESITAHTKASEIAPNWGVAAAYRALVYLEMGDTLLAYQTLRDALEKAPENPEVMTILALCYRKLYMLEHAKMILKQSLETNPAYLLSYSMLAEMSLQEGAHLKSSSILQDKLDRAPNSQFDHWLMALSHLQADNFELATQSLERAALLGGRYTLPSQIYLSIITNNYQQLEYLLQQINDKINSGNQWPELIFDKGLIFLALKKKSEAIDTFEHAMEIGFSHEYRFKNLPLFLEIADKAQFSKLLKALAQKNRQKPLKRVPRK
jgi:DNA-binding winged helix-turn-helix (wHTH) protein/Flp pilus assembly protein TadD